MLDRRDDGSLLRDARSADSLRCTAGVVWGPGLQRGRRHRRCQPRTRPLDLRQAGAPIERSQNRIPDRHRPSARRDDHSAVSTGPGAGQSSRGSPPQASRRPGAQRPGSRARRTYAEADGGRELDGSPKRKATTAAANCGRTRTSRISSRCRDSLARCQLVSLTPLSLGAR
jgi:hypothetical protein